ncbi:MAG: hypothetical protein HZA54_04425, partial [Planctomycetes bacterium]|nr:hypothetical protein [Planctomycetota bacterium]
MPFSGLSTVAEIERVYPAARLYLLQRYGIDKLEATQPLGDTLAAKGPDAVGEVLGLLDQAHRELERLYGAGRMEVWRGPLNRFLRSYCVEIALLSARVAPCQNGLDALIVACEMALVRHGGCSVVDASYTIRSQLERISFERWCEGERRGHRLSLEEERAIALRWQKEHSMAHKDWLNLQLLYFLYKEWEPFFKEIFTENTGLV